MIKKSRHLKTPSIEFHENNLTLDQARALAYKHSEEMKTDSKEKHDQVHRDIQFDKGDLVIWKTAKNHPDLNKMSPRNTGPYTCTSS
jgi:hypothetical protein